MIRLKPNPTFKFKVDLSEPGVDEPVSLTLVGRHKGQKELAELVAKVKKFEGKETEFFLLFVDDWEGVVDDGKPIKFEADVAGVFLDKRPGALLVIWEQYCKQLSAGRLKN